MLVYMVKVRHVHRGVEDIMLAVTAFMGLMIAVALALGYTSFLNILLPFAEKKDDKSHRSNV